MIIEKVKISQKYGGYLASEVESQARIFWLTTEVPIIYLNSYTSRRSNSERNLEKLQIGGRETNIFK